MTMQTTRTLNFVLAGDVRSGAAVVLSCINNRGGAVCHADLFHPTPEVRRLAHERYFGPGHDDVRPAWMEDVETNPHTYITQSVFDHPRRGETACGLHLSYPAIQKYDLFDLFEACGREGDFTVLHVVRNPVACYISLKQAEQSGIWTCGTESTVPTQIPRQLRIDPDDMTRFCRNHQALRKKITDTCQDRLEIPYSQLSLAFQPTMAKVFDYLELPELPVLATPGCRRLRNRSMQNRVSYWAEVRLSVPSDVKALMDADDLI